MIQSGIGRYGYNNKGDGAGIWLDPSKFVRIVTGNIHFKTLCQLIKVKSRVEADELIMNYFGRGFISEAECNEAIDLLPSR
jgi:hypothetical protein